MTASSRCPKWPATFALLAVLAGCASPSPTVYAIAVRPGPTVSGGPKTVDLRSIGLAGYLDRSSIVRSSDGYRLDIMANDTWGEPLGAMIGRVLAVELAQRLPGSNVYGAQGAISVSPDATLEVNIQRMDVGEDGELQVLAQAVADFGHHRAPVTQTFHIKKRLASPSTRDEVVAISEAVAELADGLALMLRS